MLGNRVVSSSVGHKSNTVNISSGMGIGSGMKVKLGPESNE